MKKRKIEFEDKRFALEEIDKESLEFDLESDLESGFSKFATSQYFLPTMNFTSALHLSMCAINLKRGDKVLCSVNSSPAIPEVVRHFDAEPIFIDIEKDSFHLDFERLRDEIKGNLSKKLKAIVVSHIAGEMANLKKIKEIVEERELYIVEDGTNSLGLDRKEADSISDVRIYSFDDEISTLGVFATDNEEMYERAKLLINHGIVYDEDTHIENYIYDVIDTGCQYTAPKLNLLYALQKLQTISSDLKKRVDIARVYADALHGVPHISYDKFSKNHAYTNFIIKVDKNRDGFAKELYDLGVETKLHYIPLHLLSYYKNKYELKINSFPNALRNYQQILSIPINPTLVQEDLEYIVAKIIEIAEDRV
jgi:perosamine synthetase